MLYEIGRNFFFYFRFFFCYQFLTIHFYCDKKTHTHSTRHLLCERNFCDEFTIVHLGFLEYAHYIITVRFYDLESFHQRYNIKDLTLFVSEFINFLNILVKWKLSLLNLIIESSLLLLLLFFCSQIV